MKSPVTSITDDQLEEIEAFCAMTVFKDDTDSPQTMGELRGLITRMRAAEADAKRYRWWRDRAGVIQDGNGYTTWVLASGSEMYELERNETDQAIDAAMERKA